MFVNIEAFLFNTLVNAQTGQLIDTDAKDLDKGRRCDAVWITWDDV